MTDQDKSVQSDNWSPAERDSLRALFRMAAYFFLVVTITAVVAGLVSLALQGR